MFLCFWCALISQCTINRLATKEAMKIKWQIGHLLESDHIQPSSSPCASPYFIVPKKYTVEWNLITDFRPVNKYTIKIQYPLPKIEDLLDHLQVASLFTNMDLTSDYHQVCMKTIDIWKTRFKIKFGLYEWLVMPLEMTNSPTNFMSLINDIFQLHMGKFVVIYLDDILVFISSLETHLQHVRMVLS